jgi:hypothetical protein
MLDNTLYHFQKRPKFILDVLQNRSFSPRMTFEGIMGDNPPRYVFPMTCFCDASFETATREHVPHYGAFGIGMKADWAVNNRVAPITYTTGPSSEAYEASIVKHKFMEQTLILFDRFYNKPHPKKDGVLMADAIQRLFTKAYKGNYFDKKTGRLAGPQKFYYEREWRYVPRLERSELAAAGKFQYLTFFTQLVLKAPLLFSHYLDINERSADFEEYINYLDSYYAGNRYTGKFILDKFNEVFRQHYALRYTPDDVREIVFPKRYEHSARWERISREFPNVQIRFY